MLKQVNVVRNAWKAHVLIPSFNASYLPMIKPIVQAVVEQDSFALIETCQIEWEEFGSKGPREVMEEFQKWDKPEHVRLHIDHIPSIHPITGKPNDYYNIIKKTIDLGYPSVMIDTTSEKNIEKSIEISKRIVDLAHKKDVLVEVEAGWMFGYNFQNMLPYEEIYEKRMGFTNEEEALWMVKETGCDWLGVVVGNIHGILFGEEGLQKKDAARLDCDLVGRINKTVHVPLVLHGGSNIQIDYLCKAVKNGVAKVNVAKALRLPYLKMMLENRSISDMQQMVYDRVTWFIKEHYQITGTSKIVTRNGTE